MIEATKKINEIIDDADRQADRIIVRAEAEAHSYVESVRRRSEREAAEYARAMAALSESLIAQAEVLSRESRRLLASIGQFTDSGSDSPESKTGGSKSAVFQANIVELGPIEGFSAGARLLATQMAAAGSSREAIHDLLVNDFGIDNPAPLLDSIMEPGNVSQSKGLAR